jgi:amino acid transporter
MGRFGALLLTLSGITPAASVFIVGQTVVQQAGGGALIAFAGVALLAVATAYVYAELSSAFPLSGAEYCLLGGTLGPVWGMMALSINLFGSPTGQAVMALGLADYLSVVIPGVPAVPAALAATLLTTIVTVLNIRLNAWVTGIFLAIELFALGVMTWLGAAHPHQPLAALALHPMVAANGHLVPASLGAIGLAASGAVYALNGYGGVVSFGEEMHEAHSRMAWVVFTSLGIALVAELAPIAAALVGAPDLRAFLSADQPFPAFIAAVGGPWLAKAVSLGVAFAIVNAMIAIGLVNARQLYCSGRDGVWPHAINAWVAQVHPRFRSPWTATLALGAATAACCLLNPQLLLIVTGSGLVMLYAGVSLAALVGRLNGSTQHTAYRMPLFPLAPVLSLIGVGAVVWATALDPVVGQPGLEANLAVMALFALYYFLYLRRRGGWQLRGADGLPLEALEGLAPAPAEPISPPS